MKELLAWLSVFCFVGDRGQDSLLEQCLMGRRSSVYAVFSFLADLKSGNKNLSNSYKVSKSGIVMFLNARVQAHMSNETVQIANAAVIPGLS